jgi:1-acyl-sn-glycerol-3-phosphate acyltransferase
MVVGVASAFLKTAFYGCTLIGKDLDGANRVKQKWASDVLKTLGFQLKIQGTPPRGSCILVGNHLSYLDIPVVLASEATATFISKDDLLKWPIIGAGAKAAGTIFVSRKSGADRSTVREKIVKCLGENTDTKIVVFPSGTTSLGETKPWKKGIFEIAKSAQVPIQLFNIQYRPEREAAYIDDDNLLFQMAGLSKVANKVVTLTWMERFEEVDQPATFAEELRTRVMKEVTEYV